MFQETVMQDSTAAIDRFSEFWCVWPRKVSKLDAIKAWNKGNCDELADTIVAAVERQKRLAWKGERRKLIPFPATWLRAGRWLDEYEVADDTPLRTKAVPILDPGFDFEPLELSARRALVRFLLRKHGVPLEILRQLVTEMKRLARDFKLMEADGVDISHYGQTLSDSWERICSQ